MDLLDVQPHKINTKDYLGRRAKLSDVSKVIDSPTIIKIDDEPAIILSSLKDDWSIVPSFLREVKYQNNQRVTRLNNDFDETRSSDISFGYRPERPIFNFPAAALTFNRLYPAWYKILNSLGQVLQSDYAAGSPVIFDRHKQYVDDNIAPPWRLPETVFTQGIINNSVALDYHFDRGNIEGAWSCMAVFRSSSMGGGSLILPELDLGLDIKDHGVVLFNGQKLLHGVTSLKPASSKDYRFSVVFYTLRAMAGLGSYSDQLNRFKRQQSRLKR